MASKKSDTSYFIEISRWEAIPKYGMRWQDMAQICVVVSGCIWQHISAEYSYVCHRTRPKLWMHPNVKDHQHDGKEQGFLKSLFIQAPCCGATVCRTHFRVDTMCTFLCGGNYVCTQIQGAYIIS